MIVLVVDKLSGNVQFWMEFIEYTSHFDLLQSVRQIRSYNTSEIIWNDDEFSLPSDWHENWHEYSVLTTPTRLSYTGPIAYPESIRSSVDNARVRIDAYKGQMKQLAYQGLPTTAIGVEKMRLIAKLAEKFIFNNDAGTPTDAHLSGAEERIWLSVAEILQPGVAPMLVAQHAVTLPILYEEALMTFISRGSLL